ncbi:hypothetical protein Moror_16671 [Moniliophthora roreri MCA 2997]|uniref:Uncharacterized protein n=2 Tax=Moniliophthora roreri TaxID=221103 RepID=V2WXC8_MONRO|nr:hypothetical protein Moror_16671 [Moniliophthora roreri MCA 2997]
MKIISRSTGVILSSLILSSYADRSPSKGGGPGPGSELSDVPPCPNPPALCCALVTLDIPNYEFSEPLLVGVPGAYPDYWPTTVPHKRPTNAKVHKSDFNVVVQRTCDECSTWKVSLVEWTNNLPTDNGEGWYKVEEIWYNATIKDCPSTGKVHKKKKSHPKDE